MTWTYDVSSLVSVAKGATANSDQLKDLVRFLIGDTDSGDQLIQDEEIIYSLAIRASQYGAAAVCCRNLAARLARKADSAQGPIRTMYSAQTRNFRAMASFYENEARSRGALPGYAGGISVADKIQQEEDPDRVPPQFNLGLDDNYLPVAPAGNESEDEGGGEQVP